MTNQYTNLPPVVDMSDLNRKDFTRKEWRNERARRYNLTPEGNAHNKARQQRYRATPEGQAKMKKYRQTPSHKARQAAWKKTEAGKLCQRRYTQSEKGKEVRKGIKARYNNTERGKAKNKAYQQTPKYKAVQAEYRKTYERSGRYKAKINLYKKEGKLKEMSRRYYQSERGRANIKMNTNKRRARKLNATVSWANEEKILNIYMQARRKKDQSGKPYAVDHIVPLKGENICGLHIESNLRIILQSTNASKGFSFTPTTEQLVLRLMARDQAA